MTYINSWEEFAKATEKLYLSDPAKVYQLKARLKDLVNDLDLVEVVARPYRQSCIGQVRVMIMMWLLLVFI